VHVETCFGHVSNFSAKLVIESRDAVQNPRVKTVFVRAIQDQDEIQRLYEESQARRGDEIAYELRREVDWSSKYATLGLETSYNGTFSSDGGILGVDFNWAKSCKQARLSCFVPGYFGPRNDNVRVTEDNIRREMNAETGITFIPWCNGQDISGQGKGVLVKFDGYKYLQFPASKTITVMPVI
jgi:hypothetical protein